jgi:hypothetical protein
LTVTVDPENCWVGGVSVLFDKEPSAAGALDVAPIVLGAEFHREPPFAQVVIYLCLVFHRLRVVFWSFYYGMLGST